MENRNSIWWLWGSTIGGLLDLVKEHVTIFFAQSFFLDLQKISIKT
jgi:hypothetical protein